MAQHVPLSAPAPAPATPCSAAARLTGACPSWFNKKRGKFASPPAINPLTLRCVIATGSTDALKSAEAQLFHKALQATGSAKGNYGILGVEFPDLTTLLEHDRGLQK